MTIAIVPQHEVVVGPTAQFQFASDIRDARNRVVGMKPAWSSEAPIDERGLFTAPDRAGVYYVNAAIGELTATTKITVKPGSPRTVRVLPSAATLKPRDTVAFSASAFDEWGNNVPATPTWKVTAGTGTIDEQGIFAAGAAGVSTITLDVDGITTSATATAPCGPTPLEEGVFIPPAIVAMDWNGSDAPEAIARHEITHLVVDEAAGRRVTVPLWLHEGLARFNEFPVSADQALVSRYCTASAAKAGQVPALESIATRAGWR